MKAIKIEARLHGSTVMLKIEDKIVGMNADEAYSFGVAMIELAARAVGITASVVPLGNIKVPAVITGNN